MPRSSLGKVELIVDTGHPLLNRTVDGFLKIGTVAVVRSAAEDVYSMAQKGSVSSNSVEHSISSLDGKSKRVIIGGRRVLKKMCKEGAYWGAIAGTYVGMEYGVAKIRGTYDYKNAMIGGALTGALVSVVSKSKGDKIVVDAITGGAIATAVEFLNYLT